MRILLLTVFLAGCSDAMLASVGQGLGMAGGALDQDAYNHGLPPPEKRLDTICYVDCMDRYSPPLCRSKCSY